MTWLELTYPDGTTVRQARRRVTLRAGQSKTWRVLVLVPFYAAAGTYTYTGLVGAYPSGPVDTDAFTFEKQPLFGDDALATASGARCTVPG